MTRLFEPRRELWRTGFHATRLGAGDLADRSIPLEQCVATLRRALDAGVNVVDTAPSYEDGYSEQIVGQALRSHGERQSVFLIDKIDHLDRPVAPQVDGSLERLGLDQVDCFLLHGLSTVDGWREAAAPGGVMDQLGQEIAAGRARFRGLSSHHPDVLEAAIRSGLCDVVMFAVGAFCDRRYIQTILPLAREHRVGVVAFKVFGAGKLLADTSGYGRPLDPGVLPPMSVRERTAGPETEEGVLTRRLPHLSVEECLHYTMSLDPDVALLGLSSPEEQDAAFRAAGSFRPLTAEQMQQIEQRAAEAVREKGPCWWDPQTAPA